MRAVVQRVRSAAVVLGERTVARIGPGLCVLCAAGEGDGPADVAYIADKLVHLRVFPAEDGAAGPGRFSRSLLEVGGELLLVPQFTLYGDVRRGRRPDFTTAAAPVRGRALLAELALALRARAAALSEGVFGADMEIALVNSGPVTILLDSRRVF